MNIIIALLILGIVIAFHEFGHFIIAKSRGITVREFSIGMGPKLYSFEKGETLYCLRLLPIGGASFVKPNKKNIAIPCKITDKI